MDQVDDAEWLAQRFQHDRRRLHAVAYRMLGSVSDAEDAVQEAWLRLSRAGAGDVEDLSAWLTTVVARISLSMLRARGRRREQPLEAVRVPDPIVASDAATDPVYQAELADSAGLALLVVLDTLSPPERLAFVLHDLFAVPYEDIAPMIDRSPVAVRQLASRARRRVRGVPIPDPDLRVQRQVVDAFFAAARDGDFDALVAVLDPEVVLRSDGGAAHTRLTTLITGAREVAAQAVTFGRLAPMVRAALVNGAAGAVVMSKERPLSIMGFTVSGSKIVAIDVISDPGRLRELDLAALNADDEDEADAERDASGADAAADDAADDDGT